MSPPPAPVVACPGLACAACGAWVGCERVTQTRWAWVHAGLRPPGCPGLAPPAATVVYLLHFVPAYRHARHYLGFADDLPARLHTQASGRGARLVAVALAAGCQISLVRLWPGTRDDERRMKNQRAVPRLLCPACPTRAHARRLAAGQGVLLDPPGGAA